MRLKINEVSYCKLGGSDFGPSPHCGPYLFHFATSSHSRWIVMIEENSQQMDYDKPWPESQGVRMAHLALYVLAKVEETGVWSTSTYRQPSLNTSAKFNAIIPILLNCTIRESLERFDCWGMAQVFWNNFSRCHHDAPSLGTLALF